MRREFRVHNYDRLLLMALSSVILASFLFSVHDNASYIPISVGIKIPNTCVFKLSTGHNCPTCGMTRSFISIGHGDFQDAFRYNSGGILTYILCLSCILYMAVKIRTKGYSGTLPYIWKAIMVQCVITVITIFAGWIYFWQ
ncbi:MAG: DUF2752 domain-containing protein [Bacillota bacterium]|nr:DUF2752 domain-containing protein [Bacillota bacterium]